MTGVGGTLKGNPKDRGIVTVEGEPQETRQCKIKSLQLKEARAKERSG